MRFEPGKHWRKLNACFWSEGALRSDGCSKNAQEVSFSMNLMNGAGRDVLSRMHGRGQVQSYLAVYIQLD
jgi:hypothetical protein